jgi:hypothetical protein
MAKMARERVVRERRLLKQEKKEARKRAALAEEHDPSDAPAAAGDPD